MNVKALLDKINKRTPTILGIDQFSQFAILVPLIEKEGELHVLFEVRSADLRRQPGEICFPGGRVEKDDPDEAYTAIRETTEELGIDASAIIATAPLDYMVSPFGTVIHPFVGVINDIPLKPNASEVGEIFTVPLSYFKEQKPDIHNVTFKVEPGKDFPFHHIIGGEDYEWQARHMEEYFYYYEDRVIWGLTARILAHFLELTNN